MAQHTQINPDALVTALTPINNSLGGKQDKTDNTLSTTDKTVSGAINETKRSLYVCSACAKK